MKSSLYHIFTVVAAASLLAGASCTSVDMGGSQDQPDRVQVSLGVNWPEGMGQDQRPEQLYLVMSRIINTVHYVWQIGPDGNIINIYPPLEPDPDPGEDTDVDAKSGENLLPEILNGDYYIMAFNNVTDSYRIDSLAAFLEDEARNPLAFAADDKGNGHLVIDVEVGERGAALAAHDPEAIGFQFPNGVR